MPLTDMQIRSLKAEQNPPEVQRWWRASSSRNTARIKAVASCLPVWRAAKAPGLGKLSRNFAGGCPQPPIFGQAVAGERDRPWRTGQSGEVCCESGIRERLPDHCNRTSRQGSTRGKAEVTLAKKQRLRGRPIRTLVHTLSRSSKRRTSSSRSGVSKIRGTMKRHGAFVPSLVRYSATRLRQGEQNMILPTA